MGDIGGAELLIILATVVVILALGTIPRFGHALGAGISDFRRARLYDTRVHVVHAFRVIVRE